MGGDYDAARVGWSNPRILTLFLLVLLLGITIGAAATNIVLHNRMNRSTVAGLNDLRSRLHLSPQQFRVVQQELDDYGKYYQNIEEEREDVAAHGRSRIMKVLTSDQQRIFASMFKQTLPLSAHTSN